MVFKYTSALHQQLQDFSDPKTKSWWEGYVKGGAPFLGVKMADIRATVHRWHKENINGNLNLAEQVDLALLLFEGQYTEQKLAGTLFLQEILLPADAVKCDQDLPRLAGLFTNGYIYDWNICDWFCVKVLGSLISKEGQACAARISDWRSAENLWQARASLVAFVPVSREADYFPLIERGCRTLISRDERFAKTAVGWILRDVSKHDASFVKRIITETISDFSTESLNNATRYLSDQEKDEFRQLLRNS
jgi:3-methyladenine DNA glycosylase AlkD